MSRYNISLDQSKKFLKSIRQILSFSGPNKEKVIVDQMDAILCLSEMAIELSRLGEKI